MVRVVVGSLGLSFLYGCVPAGNENPSTEQTPPAASASSPAAPESPHSDNAHQQAAADERVRAAMAAVKSTERQQREPAAAPREIPTTPSAQNAPAPLITETFEDDFQRPELGDDYLATSDAWKLRIGRLCVRDAKNHPLWLRRRLPTNARIEFDATSSSPDGDIKAEMWADGRSAAAGVSYDDATGYIAILGGWRNQFHVLARLDEHAEDRPEVRVKPGGEDLRARPVLPHHPYHFKVERRDGRTVRWFVDDIEVISFSDPEPLKGPGHEHFGFNNWQTPVCFDNLKITPLPE